jgi:hypothetical protein
LAISARNRFFSYVPERGYLAPLVNAGSIFVFFTISELQIGQDGLCSKAKFSLIQQGQSSSLHNHTDVSSS